MALRISSGKGEVQIMQFRKLSGKFHFLLRFCTRNWSETYSSWRTQMSVVFYIIKYNVAKRRSMLSAKEKFIVNLSFSGVEHLFCNKENDWGFHTFVKWEVSFILSLCEIRHSQSENSIECIAHQWRVKNLPKGRKRRRGIKTFLKYCEDINPFLDPLIPIFSRAVVNSIAL